MGNQSKFRAKNIILATGAYRKIVDEDYIKIRGIWGHRIDIKTSTKNDYSIHQFVSVSKSKQAYGGHYIVSIGATHHRGVLSQPISIDDNNELLKKANEIKNILDANVIKHYQGARACSVDYFPMVGKIIDSKKTLNEFPYLKNGTKVESKRFSRYENFYI